MTDLAPSPAPPVAAAFVEALAGGDFQQLGRLLAPDVRLRALVPRGPLEVQGAEEVEARFRRWFGDAEDVVLLACETAVVGDRSALGYRLELSEDGRRVVEQRVFADVVDGRIAALDVICSG